MVGLVDVHWGCDLDFDPWPCMAFPPRLKKAELGEGGFRPLEISMCDSSFPFFYGES